MTFPNRCTTKSKDSQLSHSFQLFPLLRSTSKRNKPLFGFDLRRGAGILARRVEQNRKLEGKVENGAWTAVDGAKRLCRELGWPILGNLRLFCDCIDAVAHSNSCDAKQGYRLLRDAIKDATAQAIRVDRWFFQDGHYMELIQNRTPAQKEQSELSSLEENLLLHRKPN